MECYFCWQEFINIVKEPTPHDCIIILFVTMLNKGLCLIGIRILILIYVPDCFFIGKTVRDVRIRKTTTSEWIVTFRSIIENAWCSHNLSNTKNHHHPTCTFTNSLLLKCLLYYKVTILCLLSGNTSVTSGGQLSPSMTTRFANEAQWHVCCIYIS
jgi:hypothetical protein